VTERADPLDNSSSFIERRASRASRDADRPFSDDMLSRAVDAPRLSRPERVGANGLSDRLTAVPPVERHVMRSDRLRPTRVLVASGRATLFGIKRPG
jgi:hypothetical protein